MTDLKSMFAAVRDEYDGGHDAPDRTLERALAASRQKTRSRRVVRWLVLPAAAVLTVSTAYAGATGQLGGVVDRVRDVMFLGSGRETPTSGEPKAETDAKKRGDAESTAKREAEAREKALMDAAAEIEAEAQAKAEVEAKAKAEAGKATNAKLDPKPAIEIVVPPPAATTTTSEIVAPTPSAGSAEAPTDPHAALYEEAHRLHFAARDPARALAAWDRYLAVAPSGRFAPEARYNRALALVRLGRTAEARAALRPFLDGSYRREEATKLYDALGRDE